MTTDVLVRQIDGTGYYDLSIDSNGDLSNGDFFDSSILYSIYGERRAEASEVPTDYRRGGWIGNEGKAFENGSKLWLYYQARMTRDTINGVNSAVAECLQWLVDDGYLERVEVDARVSSVGSLDIGVTLFRFNSPAERRFYPLWENTGVSSAT